jgi:indolepyruvate ferredoxin oxidoreductase alpha subunit
VLPPASFLHEKEKVEKRWPAAVDFIRSRKINEFFGPAGGRIGIVCQGGMYNAVVRALQRLGLADNFGESEVPIYVLNAAYPLVDDEFLSFCEGKEAVLVVEEGQPNYIEQSFAAMLHKAGRGTKIVGKEHLPMAGEYTGQVMMDGIGAFLRAHASAMLPA